MKVSGKAPHIMKGMLTAAPWRDVSPSAISEGWGSGSRRSCSGGDEEETLKLPSSSHVVE